MRTKEILAVFVFQAVCLCAQETLPIKVRETEEKERKIKRDIGTLELEFEAWKKDDETAKPPRLGKTEIRRDGTVWVLACIRPNKDGSCELGWKELATKEDLASQEKGIVHIGEWITVADKKFDNHEKRLRALESVRIGTPPAVSSEDPRRYWPPLPPREEAPRYWQPPPPPPEAYRYQREQEPPPQEYLEELPASRYTYSQSTSAGKSCDCGCSYSVASSRVEVVEKRYRIVEVPPEVSYYEESPRRGVSFGVGIGVETKEGNFKGAGLFFRKK